MAKDTQSNKYFCTFNNPQEYGYDYDVIIKTLYENFTTFTYACICTEQGSTLHYHLLIVCTSRIRWSMVVKHFPHVDVRKAKGSISQCKQYIQKSGKWENDEEKQHTIVKGSFKEIGECPKDKKENDSAELFRMIQEGYTNFEIFSENTEYLKMASIIDKIRFDIKSEEIESKRRLDLTVCYIQGVTGSGKSRWVLDTYGDENVYRVTNYKAHPFDGYKYHEVLCLDEYRSQFSISNILQYLDVYPISLPARYSPRPLFANKIFLISNVPLEKQYPEEQVTETKSYNAFLRRIHKVMVFNDDKTITTYDSVQDYFKANNVSMYNPTYVTDEVFTNLMEVKKKERS